MPDYIKIHEYPIERLVFGDDDYYDVDYFDGLGYQSAKIKGSVLRQAIGDGVATFYNSDGTLNGARVVDGAGNFLTFDNVTNVRFNSTGAPFGVSGFEINSGITGNFFTVRNSATNEVVLKVASGGVSIKDEYRLPVLDGTSGQVMTTDGAGLVTFQDVPTSPSTNIYNSNGTLTGDRTLDGANFQLLLQTMGQFIVESHKNGVDGNVIFEVRTDATNHSFIIRDHNTNVHVLACRDGKVEISDEYFLPNTAGINGQVLTTDGVGNSSWQNLPVAPWRPPNIQLFDALGSGGLTSAVNASAGYNRFFNGTGTAGRLNFNINLRDNGLAYDGSAIQVRIQSQLFNTNGGGNVSWSVIYKFVTANGTTNAETGGVTVTTLVNVTGRTPNFCYNDLLATISGTAGSDLLMLSIVRNTGGGTNSDIVDAIGLSLTN